ncbi:MAG TPA: NADH-quinone oxidoreductase subunit N [Terriglobia bacterium]|nr:NADH-quinone oxidoreductase subunit N [Terriglobia bacterium]
MITVGATDFLRILPELVLTLFALLLMILEPVTPLARKKDLGWFAICGIVAAGVSAVFLVANPGLAFSGSISNDTFSVFLIILLLAIAALTLLGSMAYLERDSVDHGEFYALILMATVGGAFMVASTDLIMVFIGLEISSISTYVLAGYKRGELQSNESSVKYFLLGSFATAFFLYGIAFVYGLTGTTNLDAVREILANSSAGGGKPQLLWLAVILMFVGLAFKVSTAPFQVWTPDVYQGAPAPVTAYLSTAPKAAAFAVLLRVLMGSFGHTAGAGSVVFWLLWISAVLTMCVGNLAALWQSNVKRLLAYSSIAHAGYVLVGITAGGAEGAPAVLFYLAGYALMNVGAFILIAQLAGTGERHTEVSDFTGLASIRPGVAACLTVFMLSLAGFPSTVGFFAKFYIFRSAIHSHLIGLTVIALLNSVVSVYYYLKLVVAMYMSEGTTEVSSAPLPRPLGVALALSLAGIFFLGLFPSSLLQTLGSMHLTWL